MGSQAYKIVMAMVMMPANVPSTLLYPELNFAFGHGNAWKFVITSN